MRGKRGTVLFTIIGLAAIAILFVFAASSRFSQHTRFLTLADQQQTARYILESYLLDVLNSLETEIRRPNSSVAGIFQQSLPTGTTLPATFYAPSQALTVLAADMGATLSGPPVLKTGPVTDLGYPSLFRVPDSWKGREKQGFIDLTGTIVLQKRTFSLRLRFPFKTVFRLAPLVREFILFCDKLHLEQPRASGPQDGLNIFFTRFGPDGEQETTEAPPGTTGGPWVLASTIDGDDQGTLNGKVFLGGDADPDRKLLLNLGGEREYRKGLFNDLWMVSPSFFRANRARATFHREFFGSRQDGTEVDLRGLNLFPSDQGWQVTLGIMGFRAGLEDADEIFGQVRRLRDALGADPAFPEVAGDGSGLPLASALKLRGPNLEQFLDESPDSPSHLIGVAFPGPARQIFGPVFARFFQVGFFSSPGVAGKPPLPYGTDSPAFPTLDFSGGVRFEVPAGTTYPQYMSRIVSGSPSTAGEFSHPLNLDQGVPRQLTRAEFLGVDGLRLDKPFETFAQEWLGIDPGKPVTGAEAPATLQSRICACLPDTAALKRYVGMDRKRFWVDGVVYVDGDLDLSEGLTAAGAPITDVRGGIIIAKGRIKLGRVTQGLDLPPDPGLDHNPLASFPSDRILTFVSLPGPDQGFTLTDDLQAGVQLIALAPNLDKPEDLVSWTDGRAVRFYGAIAASTLNLRKRLTEFKEVPFFLFLPGLAQPEIPLAVHFTPAPAGYRLTAGPGGEEGGS